MADKENAKDATVPGGNPESSGTGGGKGRSGGPDVDPVGNARLAGEDPSPDDRPRGDTSRANEARTPPA